MVVCDSLEKKGFAERRPDPMDRRIWRISMTPQGSRNFTKALAIVENLYRPLSQVISEKEIAKTLPLLERLYGHLKAKDTKPDRDRK
jgi:MarR family transcriptional regulator for hemolysin